MSIVFKKATRSAKKLKLLLCAPSGAGKTLGAIMIAKGIGGKFAVLDTENESAGLYSEPKRLFDGTMFTPPEFDTVSVFAPYTPEKYIEIINAAVDAGYDTLVIDSLTHEWTGSGGILEINEALAKAKYRGNTWSAFSETTPRHRALIDAILQAPINIIATSRQKTDTAQIEENGRKRVAKLGMKNELREGTEYEFDIVLDLLHSDHIVNASKDRTGLFTNYNKTLNENVGIKVVEWLKGGNSFVETQKITQEDIDFLEALIVDTKSDKTKLLAYFGVLGDIGAITYAKFNEIKRTLEDRQNKQQAGA